MKKQYSAKTLQEALAFVASEKNVAVEELRYQVIEEKKGFLGLGNKVTIEAFHIQDVVAFVDNYIKTFFEGLSMNVEVETEMVDHRIKVMLNAENNAILIGRGGETLKAMNIVTRNVTSSYFKHRYDVLIDINNYKEDRYKKVTSIALRVAKSVQRSHTDAVLDPMPNDERKVIHQLLSDMKYIRTESEGERSQRRLRIIYDPNKK